jgi:HSP20 family molecular chaperone IbpA
MEKVKKKNICVHCQKVFTCRHAHTDKTECENYESSRMSREEYERQIELKKQVKEMLED